MFFRAVEKALQKNIYNESEMFSRMFLSVHSVATSSLLATSSPQFSIRSVTIPLDRLGFSIFFFHETKLN